MNRPDAQITDVTDVAMFVVEEGHLVEGQAALALEGSEVTGLEAGVDLFKGEAIADLQQIEDPFGPGRLAGTGGGGDEVALGLAVLQDAGDIWIGDDTGATGVDHVAVTPKKGRGTTVAPGSARIPEGEIQVKDNETISHRV